MGNNSKEESSNSQQNLIGFQHKIRQNAFELQDYLSDLQSFEQKIKKKDQKLMHQRRRTTGVEIPPVRTTSASTTTVKATRESTSFSHPLAQNNSNPVHNDQTPQPLPAAAHTYDTGYAKWQKFDVDAALREVDDDEPPNSKDNEIQTNIESPPVAKLKRKVVTVPRSSAPLQSNRKREDIEKDDGNEHYKKGDFVAAIKCYTRCLGYNPDNFVVLSNRAMAYIKRQEYSKAEDDCTLALTFNNKHVKSYARRATARNALGKHRAALADISNGLDIEPNNKQFRAQLRDTREHIKCAIKRAPKVSIKVMEAASPTSDFVVSENTVQVRESLITKQQDHNPPSEIAKDKTKLEETVPENTAVTLDKADNTKAYIRPTSVKIPSIMPKIPSKPPKTSYEFCRFWKRLTDLALRDDFHTSMKLKCKYLKMIQPQSLPKIFKNSIESNIFCDIFDSLVYVCTSQEDSIMEDYKWIVEVINAFPKVPRFEMMVMFLDMDEKERVRKLFEILKTLSGCHSPSDSIDKLQKNYGV